MQLESHQASRLWLDEVVARHRWLASGPAAAAAAGAGAGLRASCAATCQG